MDYEDIKFGHVFNEDVKSAHNITQNSLFLYKDFDEERVI